MKGGWQGERARAPALSPELQARLIARYQAGESYQPLARALGLSEHRVKAVLAAAGVMRNARAAQQLRRSLEGCAPWKPAGRPGGYRRRLLTLSPQEQAVLAELAQGKRRREIAAALCLDVTTVQTHLYHAYQKLGVKNSLQAVLRWQAEEQRCDKQAG